MKLFREAMRWLRDMRIAAETRARTRRLELDQLDDADLGRFLKQTMAAIAVPTDFVGAPQAAAMILANMAAHYGAATSDITIRGVTHRGRPLGDWRIRVQKLGPDGTPVEDPDTESLTDGNLTRRIHAGEDRDAARAKLDGFDRITSMTTRTRGVLGRGGQVTHIDVRGCPR